MVFREKIYNTRKLNYVYIICKCKIPNFYENKNTDYMYHYIAELKHSLAFVHLVYIFE